MVRTFTTGFTNRLLAANTKPYLVLEIEWGGAAGIQYYLDRTVDSFATQDSLRVPSSGVSNCLVKSWGAMGAELKEMLVGSYDSYDIEIEDRDGALTDILGGQVDPYTGRLVEQQKKTVKVYRMWDEPDVVWPTDAALVLVGTTKPHDYSEPDNRIKLTVTDPTRQLLGTVGTPATAAIFPTIPEEYEDRNIPLCWGVVERVEGVLVSRPFELHIIQPINIQNFRGKTYAIVENPADLKVTPGVLYQAVLYNCDMIDSGGAESPAAPQPITLSFSQSTDPAVPSTIQINTAANYKSCSATIGGVTGTGSYTAALIDPSTVSPPGASMPLDGADANVYCQIIKGDGTVLDANVKQGTLDEDSGLWVVYFFQEAVSEALAAGQTIVFFAGGSGERDGQDGLFGTQAIYPPGSLIAQAGNWIYAVNALPSQQVYRVEGFGTLPDQGSQNYGNGRKDYILLADGFNTVYEDGSVGELITTSTAWKANLNDPTWNLGTGTTADTLAPNDLGRNITTITFNQAPRQYNNQLDDNRIWVTLAGVEDHGDSTGNLITNPALIILKYLESPYTFDLDYATYVKVSAFEAAAVELESSPVAPGLYDSSAGFAQIEQQDGLTLLQDIARQCRSVFFMDQGQFSVLMLKNDPSDWAATFDQSNIEERSITSIAEDNTDDVVTRLAANWTYRWGEHDKPRKVFAINADAEWDLGVNGKEIDIWLYSDRNQVKAEITFWLTRWSRIWRTIKFTAFSKAMILQPGDWIKTSYVNGDGRYLIPANTLAEVISVKDNGPQGVWDIVCRYVKFVY